MNRTRRRKPLKIGLKVKDKSEEERQSNNNSDRSDQNIIPAQASSLERASDNASKKEENGLYSPNRYYATSLVTLMVFLVYWTTIHDSLPGGDSGRY